MKTCANCQRAIGDLERTETYKGATVCVDCLPRLSAGAKAAGINPTRILLVLGVVAGIVIILALVIEWVRRAEIIGRYGG